MADSVEFGLGLVSLGRVWGHRPSPLPSTGQAHELLATAIQHGVRVFDTAPAYGTSEQLVGEYFRQLSPVDRQQLTLATKCGEHWDPLTQTTFVDHSYDALVRSIDTSLERLGEIAVLQIHKTTADLLRSPHMWKALDYARSCGIATFGASVSDVPTAELALEFDALEVIQLPFNLRSRSLASVVLKAAERNRRVWTNRPFAMGWLIHESDVSKVEAYRFVLGSGVRGVVLTGTSRSDHLLEDLQAFREAEPNPDDAT